VFPRKLLPLRYHTSDRWADQALSDPLALLGDHAYLERKAASNALEMLNRWPEPKRPKRWTETLASIARDEASHLDMVVKLLIKRGGHIPRLHRSEYAAELRGLVRRGDGPREILDRLLVSALIEARSAERFILLSKSRADRELRDFYRRLGASEVGHYQVFLILAAQVRPTKEVKARWNEMLEAEAAIIVRQPAGPSLHSGELTPAAGLA
jgi:tRNA-(ms[2]io[6]A)-hydroxylase